ncbi:MAG: hypothetical protein IT371_08805 [Deltaproteobacteria bacterium]|nr:hypothetical protein [Deltaproteobacteria bacterium]
MAKRALYVIAALLAGACTSGPSRGGADATGGAADARGTDGPGLGRDLAAVDGLAQRDGALPGPDGGFPGRDTGRGGRDRGPAASDLRSAGSDALVAGKDGSVASGKYLLLTKARLLTLPTSGDAWTYLRARADEAVSTPLNATSASSPWLPNYAVVAPKYLGAALVYASAWSGAKATYRKAVEDALRHVIGSEQAASTDGTASGDALLATCRQLAAWVMAADLIDFNGTLTGSRPGWTGVSFDAWLKTMLTKTIGTHGRWKSISQTHENSASNWGAHCAAARIAVSRYRGDASDVSRAALVVRGFLGDSAAYPAYPPGVTPAAGAGFQVTAGFAASWACPYAATVGGWKPINPASCGPGYDGLVVEDIARSAGAYPSWDATGIGYTYESLGALHLAALLLQGAGYPAFGWSGDALRRGMQWLLREKQLPSSANGSVQRHIPWVTNHFYGTTLPTQPAAMGRSLAFTDWLFP